jgi:hypothetical protein
VCGVTVAGAGWRPRGEEDDRKHWENARRDSGDHTTNEADQDHREHLVSISAGPIRLAGREGVNGCFDGGIETPGFASSAAEVVHWRASTASRSW